MHKRPKLAEALQVLTSLSNSSSDAAEALEQYHEMRQAGYEFLASRMVVDIVDHHYHNLSVAGIAHG